MHMAHLVGVGMFDIRFGDRAAAAAEVFPDWTAGDRFGIVIDEPFGGLGAAHLIQLATALFYDAKPSRRRERPVYPEIYALHYGRGFGAHAPFDFWPARREVLLPDDPRLLLDAINDRGITRLALPDRPRRDIAHRPKEEDAALDRIVSAITYGADGRVERPDFTIRGNSARTEYNARKVLQLADAAPARPAAEATSPTLKESDTSYHDWLELRRADTDAADRARAARRRAARLDEAGRSTESYRFVAVAEALRRL